MRFVLGIVGSIFLLNAVWWIVSNELAKRTRWRHVQTVFMLFQIAGLAWLISSRLLQGNWDRLLPKMAVTALLIWHMIVLPLLLALLLVALPLVIGLWIGKRIGSRAEFISIAATKERALSRREFLGMASAAAPPLVTLSLTGIAMRQLGGFRVRRLVLPITDLPADLHGTTIVQVSDMHVGRFTSGHVLDKVVHVTNELRGDLVLLTGDLINDALADLDHGIELARKMQGRFGTYLIEGNHDLIENAAEFERRVKSCGVPFLLDETVVVSVRGMPIQLFGLSWTRARQDRDAAIAASVQRLLSQRQPETFPILLAHHPHAFDTAADAGIPLTLSGHTHGGQLMLNEREGFGPAMFRYWSGLYSLGQSKLVVSNGVGNWFPLRVNAPAEIIHLTLLRM